MRSAGLGMSLRWLDVYLGFGFLGPALVVDHPQFQLADAGEVFVELIAVVTAEAGAQRLRLLADVVENAAAVFETAHLLPHLVGASFEEQLGEHLGLASCPRG